MGGLGYMLGGALAGYGQGMAEVAKSAEEERKQIALENLRQQNQKAMQQSQYDLADRNDARSTARETNKTIEVNKVQAGIQAERDDRLHGNEVDLLNRRNEQSMREIRERGRIDRSNSAEAARIQQEYDSGQLKSIEKGGDGYYYKVYQNGKTEKTAIPVPPPESTDSKTGTTLVEELQAGKGRAAPAAAPQPAAPPPPPRQERGQAPARPAAQKTYSQADAVATAKQHGMTVAEVHQRMKSAGYKLTN